MKKYIILIIILFATIMISGCLTQKDTNIPASSQTTTTESDGDLQNNLRDDTISNEDGITTEEITIPETTTGEENLSDTNRINTNDTDEPNDSTTTSQTDDIVNKLTDYSKSGEFDEDGVDLLYDIIDALSE